jgi:hypothetical protein
MFKGEITNNDAFSDTLFCGGGVIITGGTFRTANHPGRVEQKIIRDNYGATNGGGFVVRASHGSDYNGPGLLEIVDGTVITGNNVSPNSYTNTQHATGGAIWLGGLGTLNLYGGEIYGNIGGNSKGITWINGTINLKGNPRVIGTTNNNADYIHRYSMSNPPDQVMNIVAPLGDNARINVRDDANDRARPNFLDSQLTVIARRTDGVNATHTDATRFRYLGNELTERAGWSVIPREHERNRDLILGPTPPPPPGKFALLRVPDTIHFGERPLITTNLVGPYGDAPRASDVQADYDAGMENWNYGFEIANTTHDNWALTLQTTPFRTPVGRVGAIPVAVPKDDSNTGPIDLTLAPLSIIKRNTRGESIKWHWMQMDYKIEAQTTPVTVTAGEFQSVFTWTLLDAPT